MSAPLSLELSPHSLLDSQATYASQILLFLPPTCGFPWPSPLPLRILYVCRVVIFCLLPFFYLSFFFELRTLNQTHHIPVHGTFIKIQTWLFLYFLSSYLPSYSE